MGFERNIVFSHALESKCYGKIDFKNSSSQIYANFGTKSRFLHKTLNALQKKTLKKNFLEFLKNGHKCPPCPLQVLNTNYLMVKKYLRDKENIVTLHIQGKYI